MMMKERIVLKRKIQSNCRTAQDCFTMNYGDSSSIINSKSTNSSLKDDRKTLNWCSKQNIVKDRDVEPITVANHIDLV